MRKIIAIVLIAVMSAALLAGCFGDGPNRVQDDRIEITFLSTRTDIADTTLRAFADRFEDANPDLRVTIEAVGDYANVLRTRIAAGAAPDVFRLLGTFRQYDWSTFFYPLNDLTFLDDMMFLEENTLNGNVYAVSTYANYTGILYNRRAFEQAGITELPTTLDGLFEISEQLLAAGITPTTAFFRDQWAADGWAWKLSPIMSDDSNVWAPMADTDTPFVPGTGLFEAARIYRELYDRGFFENDLMGTTWDGAKVALARGEFGWILMETWLIPQIIDEGARTEDIGFFPLPTDNSGVLRTLVVPDDTLVVSRDSRNPEAAKRFIDFIMNEGYADWLELTGGFSTRRSFQSEMTPQMEEFLSFDPIRVEIPRQPDEVVGIMNRAQIQWRDLAVGSISDGLEATASSLNDRWARARAR